MWQHYLACVAVVFFFFLVLRHKTHASRHKGASVLWRWVEQALATCVDTVRKGVDKWERTGRVIRLCCILMQLCGLAIEGLFAQLNFRFALLYFCSTYPKLAAPVSKPQGSHICCSDY